MCGRTSINPALLVPALQVQVDLTARGHQSLLRGDREHGGSRNGRPTDPWGTGRLGRYQACGWAVLDQSQVQLNQTTSIRMLGPLDLRALSSGGNGLGVSIPGPIC